MRQKLKFKPVISRIKLNPEQAVLSCSCYGNSLVIRATGRTSNRNTICGTGGTHGIRRTYPTYSGTSANRSVS